MIHGEGPLPCKRMIVGEGPGWQEARIGRVFVGPTGIEIDRLIGINNLPPRRQWFMTNIYRDYKGKDYEFTAQDLEACEPHLLRELEHVKPLLIVTLGREATRYFLGDVDMDGTWGIPWYLPDDRGMTLRLQTGLPENCVIFPIYHPAAGMHNPNMSPLVNAGFKELQLFMLGKIDPRRLFDDPVKETTYEEITSESRLAEAVKGLPKEVGIDTEGWPGRPWSLQFSGEPGRAYLLRQTSTALLRRFSDYLREEGIRPIFHSALHDLGIGESLGVHFDGVPFDDTMTMAYLLQIVPKGLKPAALRYCGMKMMEFSEVLGDTANRLAREYLTWIWDSENAKHEEKVQQEFETHLAWGRRIKAPPKLPKSKLLKAVERVMKSKRAYDLWEEQVEDLQVAAYKVAGPLPVATLDYVQPEVAIPYGCRDADATRRLFPEYSKRIDDMELRPLYNLELATYPFIHRMQTVGLKPDLVQFSELSALLDMELDRLNTKLCTAVPMIPLFNANSGDQVAEFLFGHLRIPEVKMTRSGRGSTNDAILEALEHEHPEFPIISDIREYRALYKLKNTFVDRIPDFVNRWPYDGRVHTTFRATSVITGRLAASDPNVLAMPVYGTFGPEFKRGWIADDGNYLYSWDQSQIELRGLAHLSQDPVLLAVYRGQLRDENGDLVDLHAKLAQRIFGGKTADYKKGEKRRAAKAINFGIPMGMTEKGLSVQLRLNGVNANEATAKVWLTETLNLYAGVRSYMATRIQEAQRRGYVRCLSGRVRYIGGIRSRDERVRTEAERFAFSTPIQESATFIMKQAEVNVWSLLQDYWRKGDKVEPILQIHDALKLEGPQRLAQDLNARMTKAMTEVPHGFSVPLAVEGEYGRNMADTEDF